MKAFISYSFEDTAFAARLAADLRTREGVDAFLARWEIRAGDQIARTIDSALSEAQAFLLILSPASVSSVWVQSELNAWFGLQMQEEALAKRERRGSTRRLVPLLFRDCPRPAFVTGTCHLAINDANYEEAFAELIQILLGQNASPPLRDPVRSQWPRNFVHRRSYEQRVSELLQLAEPDASNTFCALWGASGYGKSLLAASVFDGFAGRKRWYDCKSTLSFLEG
jgi:hypothetical protein